MKKFLIGFLLLFLVVSVTSASSFLPSLVYAEDGYHCGKITGESFNYAMPVDIASWQVLSVNSLGIINDDSNFYARSRGIRIKADKLNSQPFQGRLFRRARDGLTEDSVIWLC